MVYQTRRSGGTTGEPIKSLISQKAAAFEVYTHFKGMSLMGWKQEMKMVKIFGGSLGVNEKKTLRSIILDYAQNSIQIPAFELDQKNIISIYRNLRSHKSLCIMGYASVIYNFFYFLRMNNLHLRNIDLVLTTSEQLIEDWRHFIKESVNCPVRSFYGCGEINSLGYQISSEEAYKIPNEHVYIESDSDSNELVITQLHNKAQPLIRYVNGDIGDLNSKQYASEIVALKGRTADMFYRSDGSMISPIFGTHSIFKSKILVRKYQYIQYSDLKIEFRYLMENGELSNNDKEIIQNIAEMVMKEKCKIKFLNTNDFIISDSGKHRICVRLANQYHKSS